MNSHSKGTDDRREHVAYTAAQLETRALVRRRLATARARKRRIRRLVAAGAVSTFFTATGLIGVQMASGHDPALSALARKKASTTAMMASASASQSLTSATTSTTNTATRSAGATSTSTTASASPSSTPAAVTTSQS